MISVIYHLSLASMLTSKMTEAKNQNLHSSMDKLGSMVRVLKRRLSSSVSLSSRLSFSSLASFCEYETSVEDLCNPNLEPGRCCLCRRIYGRNQDYARLECGHRYHVGCLSGLQMPKQRKLQRTNGDLQSRYYCCKICASLTSNDDVRVVIFLI